MKATKKPIEIDFFIWNDECGPRLRTWVESFSQTFEDNFTLIEDWEESDHLEVKTLEGTSYNVPNGYIIIRGVKGEYYPCEPNIFKQTYDTNGPIS